MYHNCVKKLMIALTVSMYKYQIPDIDYKISLKELKKGGWNSLSK